MILHGTQSWPDGFGNSWQDESLICILDLTDSLYKTWIPELPLGFVFPNPKFHAVVEGLPSWDLFIVINGKDSCPNSWRLPSLQLVKGFVHTLVRLSIHVVFYNLK